jgi:hypothetical protein
MLQHSVEIGNKVPARYPAIRLGSQNEPSYGRAQATGREARLSNAPVADILVIHLCWVSNV